MPWWQSAAHHCIRLYKTWRAGKGKKCPGSDTGELFLLFSSDPRDAIKELLEGISRAGEYSQLLLWGCGSGVAIIYKLSRS